MSRHTSVMVATLFRVPPTIVIFNCARAPSSTGKCSTCSSHAFVFAFVLVVAVSVDVLVVGVLVVDVGVLVVVVVVDLMPAEFRWGSLHASGFCDHGLRRQWGQEAAVSQDFPTLQTLGVGQESVWALRP
eukprot:m.164730 g.164730  ORF g.164730 m.164730 type:complete len:130 (-) comp31352_c2_seq3:441-830(-)